MQNGYSIRVSQDDWDSPEVRLEWARLMAGSLDADLLGKCPKFVDHLRGINDPCGLFLTTVRDAAGSICGVVPLCFTRPGLKFEISGTDRQFSASFDRQASATLSFSFPCLFPPVARKTVFFVASFHRGAMQAWILCRVSMERRTTMPSLQPSSLAG